MRCWTIDECLKNEAPFCVFSWIWNFVFIRKGRTVSILCKGKGASGIYLAGGREEEEEVEVEVVRCRYVGSASGGRG